MRVSRASKPASRALDAHRLNQNLAGFPFGVELDHEDSLELAQRHAAVYYGYVLARSQNQMLAVGVSVGTLVFVHVDCANGEVVVAVVGVLGREPFERRTQVGYEQRLVFLNGDGGGGVSREHQREPVSDFGTSNAVLDVFRYVEESGRASGAYLEVEDTGLNPRLA